uniref:Putative ribonuclease H-like domain-containing protein n=1 Tax=Tanacetum cinerariifolium TaxID=118510 RepID=A0A6L2KM39_TANCI|nr:putative ribonuclease H-like domain-containing protein [Tanacetum cinerariifolium]
MTFLSSLGSTNEVDTTLIQVSSVNTPVSTVSSHDNTANLSDATMYAFLANQPNRSQLVHEDLKQILEDDLEEMDLKWQLALLSMKARRNLRNQESRLRNQDNSRKTVNVEDTSSKAMVVINGAGFDWSYMADDEVPTNMALMDFSDSEGTKVASAVGKQGINIVKSSACWVWRPKIKGDPQDALKDQGYFDSRCSRHMIGNISYLTDFKEHDRGYVAFGGGAKGCKITKKGTIRTATKDETSRMLKSFITEIENLVEKKVKIIICDNGTEFKNRVMNEFCEEKTSWESLMENWMKASLLAALHLVKLLDNTTLGLKRLRKICILISWSKPMIAGGGPKWLFKINALSKSMHYAPVPTGTNSFAGKGASFNAGINFAPVPAGVEADYNHLESVILVSLIPSTRIHKDYPKELKELVI